MAHILLFPAERASAAVQRPGAPPPQAKVSVLDPGIDAWIEDDAATTGSLERVASLAATPSQSLAVLASKMKVLVARLAPDDGIDTGLCIAEASLMRSVLRELCAFAMDAVFAAQGAGLWVSIPVEAILVQENGAS